jgi:uncharacterized damage-inducible protein DinB
MLESWLDYHRSTLLIKCDGLAPEQLAARAVPPSSLSLLGLVRHMTEVERQWFQRVFAGTDAAFHYCTDDDPDADFDGALPETADDSLDLFAQECESSRKVVDTAASLDDLGNLPKWGDVSLRWILVHMIEEYARHNGHADLLRERIDGAVGE